MLFPFRRRKVCLHLQVMTLLFISTPCYESRCPKSLQRSGASREASIIPEGEVEKAFLEAEARIRFRNENEIILKEERSIMKEKSKGPNTAHRRERISTDHQADRRKLVLLEASNILAQKYQLPSQEVYGELAQRQVSGEGSEQNITCNSSAKYRTQDGSCNHFDQPTWGKANTCNLRLLPPKFGDNETMRRTKDCGPLPNPRDISEYMFSGNCANSETINQMNVFFSQMIAHDIIRTEGSGGGSCCGSSQPSNNNCAAIKVRENDSFYSQHNITCREFKRSAPCYAQTEEPRSGKNLVTSCFDGSAIYGNSIEERDHLRRNDESGKLQSQMTDNGELLPNCSQSGGAEGKCNVCYKSGDPRTQQNIPLTAVHVLWLREHNRIAGKFKALFPDWSEETTFEETRKIIIALIQLFVYKEFLPTIVGPDAMRHYGLEITPGRTVCDNETNPGMFEEVGMALFRYAHYIINNELYEDSNGKIHLLRDAFFCSDFIQKEGVDYVIRGIMLHPAALFDCCVVSGVRNFLHRRDTETGDDLASIDIQRGRDHGLPPYIDFVKFCMNRTIESFDDFAQFGLMTRESALYLQCTYRTLEAVDVFAAICHEIPVKGGIVGPVTACILGLWFKAARWGDCHWFQDRNSHNNAAFTDGQLETIKNYTMTSFICHTTGFTEAPQKTLEIPKGDNPMVPCEHVPDLDFGQWKDVVENV